MKKHTISFVAATLAVVAGCQNASKLDRMSGSPSAGRAPRVVAKPAKLEFFVMSKCPYGVQVETAVAPVLQQLGDNVDFHIAFIGDKQGDELTSMHGPTEVAGDIAQLARFVRSRVQSEFGIVLHPEPVLVGVEL